MMNAKAILLVALAALAAASSLTEENASLDVKTEAIQSDNGRKVDGIFEAFRDKRQNQYITGEPLRIAYMDAGRGDNCPDGFYADESSSGKRFCRRTVSPGCTSIIYTTNGKHYTDILGSVRGYQIGTTDAFDPYYNNQSIDINGVYVDGVSITQGANRNHIWTYAAGVSEQASNKYACPCTGAGNYAGIVPPFVYWSGSSTINYYSCESGNSHGPGAVFDKVYDEDRLWDGSGCASGNTCCDTPQYFWQTADLSSDYIEVRVCTDSQGDEDVGIEFIEIAVF